VIVDVDVSVAVAVAVNDHVNAHELRDLMNAQALAGGS